MRPCQSSWVVGEPQGIISQLRGTILIFANVREVGNQSLWPPARSMHSCTCYVSQVFRRRTREAWMARMRNCYSRSGSRLLAELPPSPRRPIQTFQIVRSYLSVGVRLRSVRHTAKANSILHQLRRRGTTRNSWGFDSISVWIPSLQHLCDWGSRSLKRLNSSVVRLRSRWNQQLYV